MSQIALAGEGITHAIGLGGRDLSREVGGISALTALEMLSADEKSEVWHLFQNRLPKLCV